MGVCLNTFTRKLRSLAPRRTEWRRRSSNALSRASKTIRNMRWFEVTETRGYIDDGKVDHWQVTLKIGFTLEE